MEITIKIECDTVQEIYQHLEKIQEDIKSEAYRLELDPMKDEFTTGQELYDCNCYGTHKVMIEETQLR